MATQVEIAAKLGLSDRWFRKLIEAGALSKPRYRGWDLETVAREIIAYESATNHRLRAEIASLNAQLHRQAFAAATSEVNEDGRSARP